MKCRFCGHKTTYEKSVGRDTFIVCNDCVAKMSKTMGNILRYTDPETGRLTAITAIILEVGKALEKED